VVSFAARRAAKVIAAVVAFIAFAPLGAPCAAAVDPAVYEEQQRQILASIEEIRARDGQYSPALRDELVRLIVLYRENEDHALALVAIERALQVIRANSGLYTLDQVPLLMQRLESEDALGNDAAVWDLEQELLTLARRHPDDPQAVPVLRAVADRQMEVVGRVVDSNEIPPQMIYGCYYQEWATIEGRAEHCNAGSRSTAVQGMLADANRNHADAIAILLRNDAYSSTALRELEMDLVRGAKLIQDEYERDGNRSITGSRTKNDVAVPLVPWSTQAELREPWRSRMASIVDLADWDLPYDSAGRPEEDFLRLMEPRDDRFRAPYYRGRQSLRRLYMYSVVVSSPPLEQAAAIVQMADWDLLFSSNGLAIDGYTLAHGMLERAGLDEAALAPLFAPELPVVLPAFEPNPLARDEARPESGYIDVAFAITKYGRAREIEIRSAMNATGDARSDLVGFLKSSRFRPRTTDGRFGDSPPVVVRYHLYD
jgi:hypothetical protein